MGSVFLPWSKGLKKVIWHIFEYRKQLGKLASLYKTPFLNIEKGFVCKIRTLCICLADLSDDEDNHITRLSASFRFCLIGGRSWERVPNFPLPIPAFPFMQFVS